MNASFNALAMIATFDQMGLPIGRKLWLYCIWSAEAMARNGYLPFDLQALLSYMEDLDSDESDGDFDGYVHSNDEEYAAGREER